GWSRSLVPARAALSHGVRDVLPDRDELPERVTVMGPGPECRRIAVMGGVYSNWAALAAFLEDARRRDVDALFCLGDMGGFGPHPDRVFPLVREGAVLAIQGNYDESLASGRTDCGCGYTDPRDNHYALVSYRYTFERTSSENKRWLGGLPARRQVKLGSYRVL